MTSGMGTYRRRDGRLRGDANVSIAHLLTAVIMTARPHHHALEDFRSRSRRADHARYSARGGEKRSDIIDAAARRAGDGLQLALNIAGMLIAFLAFDRDGQRRARLRS